MKNKNIGKAKYLLIICIFALILSGCSLDLSGTIGDTSDTVASPESSSISKKPDVNLKGPILTVVNSSEVPAVPVNAPAEQVGSYYVVPGGMPFGYCSNASQSGDYYAGVGTITFINNNGIFAGLGHSAYGNSEDTIIDEDCCIYPVIIETIIKSTDNTQGQLIGCIDTKRINGNIITSNDTGVYGTYDSKKPSSIRVALKKEIQCGDAEILTTVDCSLPKSYRCIIKSINNDNTSNHRDMTIVITDEELLEKTGGILQGMSGSPIIQNGAIIGAITHVFLDNPEYGYGIFAETMLNESYLYNID